MDNKKIRVLMMPSDGAGVGHYRSIWPAQQLQENYDDFHVEIDLDFKNDIEYYKSFDIIHFHRQFGPYENLKSLVEELRKNGTIVIMDLDDYWIPSKTHPMYLAAVNDKLAEKITTAFKTVDYVTTTTDIFANHIKKYNPNVQVIPNGIDLNQPMWRDQDTRKTDKVRVAWIGGSSHLADLELLTESMNMLHNDSELFGKYQFVMCGYDVRGFMTEIGPKGEHVSTRKIAPAETIWNKFEEIFTNKYNPHLISEEYQKYLKKYANEPYKLNDVYQESYIRRWTLPLTRYGEHYNYCDVCLAPLAENIFNEVKSELKVIEAGLKRKALIAQDYGIYSEVIENGVNGILIPKKDNTRGWYKAIKRVVEDKDYRESLSNNLYNYVIDKYTLEAVTKVRVEFYRKAIEARRNEKLSLQTSVSEANA